MFVLVFELWVYLDVGGFVRVLFEISRSMDVIFMGFGNVRYRTQFIFLWVFCFQEVSEVQELLQKEIHLRKVAEEEVENLKRQLGLFTQSEV